MRPVIIIWFADKTLPSRWKRILTRCNDYRIRSVLERFHSLLELPVPSATVAHKQRDLIEAE